MPVVTNVVEIVVQGTVATAGSGAKAFNNVFHYRYNAGGGGPASATAVAASFITNVWAIIAARLNVGYVGVATLCRIMDDATNQYATSTVPTSGAVAGARLPTQTAVALLLRSAQRGKSFRGSKHFGVITEADQLNDELTAAAATAWAGATTSIGGTITASGGAVYVPIVLSRVLSQLRTNPTTIVASDVIAVLLNKTLGTMRHRKEKTVR